MASNLTDRKVNAKNYQKCNVDDYVHDAGLIWPRDKQRPIFDLWFYVLKHAAKLGEALRREEYAEAGHEVGRIAVWLFSTFAKLLEPNKKGIDGVFFLSTPLSKIIWNKYPNCCPVCYEDAVIIPRLKGKSVQDWGGSLKTCECILSLEAVERRKEKSFREDHKEAIRSQFRKYANHFRPKDPKACSLDNLEKMFFQIFQPAITVLSPESIGFHFLEEVGEVSEALMQLYTFGRKEDATPALYKSRQLEVENEIADVFSWLFALSGKLRLLFKKFDQFPKRLYPGIKVPVLRHAPNMWISKRIWAEYATKQGGFGCRLCGNLVCQCPIFLAVKGKVRDTMLGR